MEAIPAKKSPNATLTGAEIGRQYCDKLFAIEDRLKDLSPEERYRKRQELEKPVLDAFWCWLDSLNTLKGSASATVYSLIETEKANGLNVYVYLQHILLYMPGSEWQTYPEELDALMPWATEVQKNCK